jgi:hypothetical protein
MKKPNKGSADIQKQFHQYLHTQCMEELYTAVQKKPKGNREDEKEVPPIPSYTIEDTVRRDDHISRYALVKVIKNECLKYSHKQAR